MNAPEKPDKFQRYRDRRKARGLKEVRMWLPDISMSLFQSEARRQAVLLRSAPEQNETTDFIEALAAGDPAYTGL